MNIPDDIVIEGDKNKEIKTTINGVLAFLRSKFPEEKPQPASWSQSAPQSQLPPQLSWEPIGDGSKYWKPPTGWKNREGVHIAGIVPRSEVPSDVLEGTQEPSQPISNE